MKYFLFGIIVVFYFAWIHSYSTLASSYDCATEKSLFQMSGGDNIDTFTKAHIKTIEDYQSQKKFIEFQIQKNQKESNQKYGSGSQEGNDTNQALVQRLYMLETQIESAEKFYQDHLSNIEATRIKLIECRKTKMEYNLSLVQSGTSMKTKEKILLLNEAIKYADDRKMKRVILKEKQKLLREKQVQNINKPQ